jgi:hypothetical protein
MTPLILNVGNTWRSGQLHEPTLLPEKAFSVPTKQEAV